MGDKSSDICVSTPWLHQDSKLLYKPRLFFVLRNGEQIADHTQQNGLSIR